MHDQCYEIKPIPAAAGIGLRAEHYVDIINTHPNIAWLEVHSENYFGIGGKPHHYLDLIRQNYPLSFHGVGLSLGSTDKLNLHHLNNLKNIVNRYAPNLISEHLCWTSVEEKHFNDLLPLPYTEESLIHIIDRINQVQDYLKRQILIENITAYLEFNHSTIPEYEYINNIADKTGCGILLDINNLYINSINLDWSAPQYLINLSKQHVKEIHLAGFTENQYENSVILIDSHSSTINHKVWELYTFALKYFGRIPTLIEWDKDLPSLDILINEANKANKILEKTDAAIV